MPTIHNADTSAIRPDLVNQPIEHWRELLNPEFSGKTGIVNIQSIGVLEAAMALESHGDLKYGDKGDMARQEIDKTIKVLKDFRRQGHWRSLWKTFRDSVNPMVAGEVVIQSMWSPTVTAVRSRGIPCKYVSLKEGYRGWANGLGLIAHLNGMKLDATHDYLNSYLSGWQGAFVVRLGYYSAVPETAKEFMSAAEWDCWYDGKEAVTHIEDHKGNLQERAGRMRDGGSHRDRMARVSCWNAIMPEHEYLVERWNEFIEA